MMCNSFNSGQTLDYRDESDETPDTPTGQAENRNLLQTNSSNTANGIRTPEYDERGCFMRYRQKIAVKTGRRLHTGLQRKMPGSKVR